MWKKIPWLHRFSHDLGISEPRPPSGSPHRKRLGASAVLTPPWHGQERAGFFWAKVQGHSDVGGGNSKISLEFSSRKLGK